MTEIQRNWEDECRSKIWPFHEDPDLSVDDIGGDVAICLLWNQQRETLPHLPLAWDRLAVVGNLYTPEGVSWFLRGLGRLPTVTTVVVWGGDLLETGESLLRLWGEGFATNSSTAHLDFKLDEKIDSSFVDRLRADVKIVDARRTVPLKKLRQFLVELELNLTERQRVVLPPPEPVELQSLPDPYGKINLRVTSMAQGWVKGLDTLLLLGRARGTRKKEALQWRPDISVTAPVPREESIADCFLMAGFDQRRVEAYWNKFFSPVRPEGADYGYGERALDWRGHNQVEELIQRLKGSPETKRGTIVFLEPADIEELEDAPCLVASTFWIDNNGNLDSSSVFRSHDFYGGWPLNVFALLRLQRYIAGRVGAVAGHFSVLSQNAQVYSSKLGKAQKIVEERLQEVDVFGPTYRFTPDSAGNFVFGWAGDQVTARMTAPSGEVVWEISHENPVALMRYLVNRIGHWLDPMHVLYLGAEMEKLQQTAEYEEEYIQG